MQKRKCMSLKFIEELYMCLMTMKNNAKFLRGIDLKLYPIQVIISLPLRIKLTYGQLLLLFLCNFSSFCSYIGGVLVTNFFSLLFIDIFWLFSKLQHTRSIWDNPFDMQRSSELPQKRWNHCINNRKPLKQPQIQFH